MSDTDTLKDAIEDLESSAKVLGRVEFLWERDDVVPTYEMENAQKAVNAARSSLESLYRAIEAARDEWEHTADTWMREVDSLRSLQLTRDEAKHLLTSGFQANEVRKRSADFLDATCKSVEAKLQRISSKATSEEL